MNSYSKLLIGFDRNNKNIHLPFYTNFINYTRSYKGKSHQFIKSLFLLLGNKSLWNK
jgi:hypothetical protein